jgi:hypothetical protein
MPRNWSFALRDRHGVLQFVQSDEANRAMAVSHALRISEPAAGLLRLGWSQAGL